MQYTEFYILLLRKVEESKTRLPSNKYIIKNKTKRGPCTAHIQNGG